MGSEKDHLSDDVGDADLPSDFFDDFSKDDFMNGLSVIDSWNDEDNTRRRIDTETLDSVKDLRELIGDGRVEEKINQTKVSFNSKYKWEKGNLPARHSRSAERRSLDDFIKPGSRRDPNKTSEAIKKDKEEKVKEYLAKRLEFSDNLQPPGTELDDYFTENKAAVKNKSLNVTKEPTPQELLPNKYKRSTRESPGRPQQGPRHNSRHTPRSSRHRSPLRSPQHSPRCSPHRSQRHSPQNSQRYGRHHSPLRSPQHSPRSSRHLSPRRSPQHSPRQSPPLRRKLNRSPHRNFRHGSPQRKYKRPMQRSPRRYSPQWRSPRRHSPQRQRSRRQSSRSPRRSYTSRHSPKSQPRDNFLYPAAETPGFPPMANYQGHPGQPYPGDFSGVIPGYAYPQGAQYAGYSGPGYDYGMQPEASVLPLPQPVPPPVVEPSAAPGLNLLLAPGQTPVPEMVPPPSQLMSPATVAKQKDSTRPYDALAQLVADGKLSKEDYLKLAPNKGMSNSMDPKARILMLNRCNHAVVKLNKLLLPNRLLMNSNVVGKEPKCLENKFCSPLKRQPNVEFQFTKSSGSSIYQNKQLVDSIIATVGLDKVVARTKKKIPRNMRDAACQTVRPHCDVCEVRESTKVVEAGTSTEPDYFSSSVHTQVVEHDLMNSKSVFNPTGSAPGGNTMSIAHLTPAQLVSQLAARAKTLKQTSDPEPPSNQYGRYNQPNNYDNRGQYNYNYRY